MKNKTYILGIITAVLLSVGCLFKMNHWPLAGIILAAGFVLISLVFIPLSFASAFKNESNKKFKNLYIAAGVVFSLNFIAALLKIMHWSGGNTLTLITIPLPFIVLLPMFLYYNRKEKEINYKNFMPVIFFFAYFAAISALLSLSVLPGIVEDYLSTTYNYEEKTKAINEENNSFYAQIQKDSSLNADDKALLNDVMSRISVINTKIEILKKKLVIDYSGNPSEVIINDNIDYLKIRLKDAKVDVVYYYQEELVQEIQKLSKQLEAVSFVDIRSKEFIDKMANDWKSESWQRSVFNGKILISSLESLNMMKYQLAMVQNAVLLK